MTQRVLAATLVLTDHQGAKAGKERIDLLEEIGICGSISAAAKSVGISYKSAWDATNTLNNLFPKPLVISRTGGKAGGGAELTDEGRHVIEAFYLLLEWFQQKLLILKI